VVRVCEGEEMKYSIGQSARNIAFVSRSKGKKFFWYVVAERNLKVVYKAGIRSFAELRMTRKVIMCRRFLIV
jgi:hypothetical protein